MRPTLYADLRCLQDPLYQQRGIGHHVASILRSRPENDQLNWTVVGLVDDSLGTLPPDYSSLIDEVTLSVNPTISKEGAVFLDCSPMTHDPAFSLRFTSNMRVLKAAIVYDFIPFDCFNEALDPLARIEYLGKLTRLRNFDFFLPISHYAAARLSEIVGVSPGKTAVTGACVRRSLYDQRDRRDVLATPYDQGEQYFLLVGGGDRRKNTQAAVAAVRSLNETQPQKVRLRVVGQYPQNHKAELFSLAGHSEGMGFLEFCNGVNDEILVQLYANSLVTIVPSYIEGFSLPVAEAAVCGAPVLASSCSAHLELITETDAIFAPDDYPDLTAKLLRVLRDSRWREQLIASQAPIAETFREAKVGARFWNALGGQFAAFRRSTWSAKRTKPRVAFLSPYPPEQSGVARYSQLTIEAAAQSLDIDLFTNAPRPITVSRFSDAGEIGKNAFLKGDYDAIISVLGNSGFHAPIFDVFERYGGPCILHDSRLTHVYFLRLGKERFLDFASAILGKPVTMADVHMWLQDRCLPSLFVEPILKRARPLIVHTRQFQSLLRERYGIHAEVTTCCPNTQFTEDELSSAARAEARQALNTPRERFLISSFGFVSKAKGMEASIIAIEMLRSWNVPADLYFVGDPLSEAPELARLARECGVTQYIHWADKYVDERTYRHFLLGSDAAVQLRGYGLGQYSAALGDCIAAALPCVATTELADSCDAPSYVRTVPSQNAPLQLAEHLASIWEDRQKAAFHIEARNEYLSVHNFGYYVKRLREILELT